MTDVKKGDRVRVVLEGEATSEHGYGSFDIDGTHFIDPNTHRHVVSVEVLAKQFKVGDTVEGNDYAKLPVGTGVAHSETGTFIAKVDDNCWADKWAHYANLSINAKRKIVFLP